MNIYLIGFMGVGKTTVAKQFNDSIDIDTEVEQKCHHTVREIIEKRGENFFRNCEAISLREFDGNGLVISCGGGIVLREENIEWMKEHGVIVWLDAGENEIVRRIGNKKDRPLFNIELKKERDKIYRKIYNCKIYTEGMDIKQIVNEVKRIQDRIRK